MILSAIRFLLSLALDGGADPLYPLASGVNVARGLHWGKAGPVLAEPVLVESAAEAQKGRGA
jgi:hypothetical protein